MKKGRLYGLPFFIPYSSGLLLLEEFFDGS